jgi:hypothetical protein
VSGIPEIQGEYSSTFKRIMEVGTIIGDKAYSVQYIVDA